jgi:phage tail-like protein
MAQIPDPFGNHYFMLEIDGEEVSHILQVSGLKTQAQVFEIEEGGNNGFVHKRVAASRWDNITIRYATSGSRFLQSWRDGFLQNPLGEGQWRGGSIVMFNNHGDPVRRFHFSRAWPVSWEGPSLDSGNSELAVESLELAHEGISVSDR